MDGPDDQTTTFPTRISPRETATVAAAESAAIRSELSRLGALLDDAASRLTTGFESLTAHVHVQATFLRGLCRSSAGPVDRHASFCPEPEDRQHAFETSVDDVAGIIVTALQFHDIATQILNGVRARLDSVDALSSRVWGELLLTSEYESLALRPNVPTQINLDVGSIELF